MKTVDYSFVMRRLATILSVAILTLVLVTGFTGTLLAFYYQPTAGGAYRSLTTIVTEVSSGWLILSLHNLAGNFVVIAALIQLVVMFLGRQFRASWLTGWISNILLILITIGLAWTAMLLGWNQEGYWRFQIELGTIEAIPVIGKTLRYIVTGGGGVSTVTVEHLYALHSYLLSIGAVVLSLVHLSSLLVQELQAGRTLLPVQWSDRLTSLLGTTPLERDVDVDSESSSST